MPTDSFKDLSLEDWPCNAPVKNPRCVGINPAYADLGLKHTFAQAYTNGYQCPGCKSLALRAGRTRQ